MQHDAVRCDVSAVELLVPMVIHKRVRVLQETFLNDHLLKKDYPLQSSTIRRIWHPPPRN